MKRCYRSVLCSGAVFVLLSMAVAPQVLFAQGIGPDAVHEARRLLARGDTSASVSVWRYLARRGNTEAQYELGYLYEHGTGRHRDYAIAAQWYRRAAEAGHMNAQYRLGTFYGYGRGVEQDDEEAARWYRVAGEQGVAAAQYALGRAYEHGRGVEQGDEEASRWYLRAVHQGHFEAKVMQDKSDAGDDLELPDDAHPLCSGHVSGAMLPDGTAGPHITWETHSSQESRQVLVQRYLDRLGTEAHLREGTCDAWRFPASQPVIIFRICDLSAESPWMQCPADPPEGAASIIVISWITQRE